MYVNSVLADATADENTVATLQPIMPESELSVEKKRAMRWA